MLDHSPKFLIDTLTDSNDKASVPSLEAQSEFFRSAFMEGAAFDKGSPLRKGPYYDDFVEIMQLIGEKGKAVDPDFTPEWIMAPAYQGRDVQTTLVTLDEEAIMKLIFMKNLRFNLLESLTQNKLLSAIKTQEIPDGYLDVPPYCYQGEGADYLDARHGCTNACFRMIFSAINGWTPSETVVAEQLRKQYTTAIVDDAVYSNVYDTQVFSEISDCRVKTADYIGADLDRIYAQVRNVKTKLPLAKVYCMVTLESNTAGKNTWHKCILLGANKESQEVICHDPSQTEGGAHKIESYERFTERWATAYNRAQLVIVT